MFIQMMNITINAHKNKAISVFFVLTVQKCIVIHKKVWFKNMYNHVTRK
jgi:hypothetical protein